MWTENRIIWSVVQDDRFSYIRNYTCVPNVSHGMLLWEADLLVMSKAGYVTEVEAKISMADWKNDKHKKKFQYLSWNRINYFWYAVPKSIASRWEEAEIPDYAGVMAVSLSEISRYQPIQKYQVEIIKPAERRHAEKWTDEERHNLTRLGVMRYWGMLNAFLKLSEKGKP